MTWLTALINAIGAAITAALSRKPATAEPAADPPRPPGFDAIRAAEAARVAAELISTTPVTNEPPPSAVDRANEAGAMKYVDDEPKSEGVPTVRKP